MKENEDYLGDLLNMLGEDENSGFDQEENFSDEGGFDLSDLIDKSSQADDFSTNTFEEVKKPLSTLEQLMAEMESESEAAGVSLFEDDSVMSGDSLDSLLGNMGQMTENLSEDNISYDITDDVDMSEIESLLNMSDNNEIVDEDETFLRALNGMGQEENDYSSDDYVEEEVLELDPAELDALLMGDQGGTEEAGVSDAPEEGSDSKESDTDKNSKAKKQKKEGDGIFKKIFSLLMEEYPDEEPKEAGSLNLSEENKDILTQLDKEKDKKKKKDKKDKKEKKNKGDKAQKPEKPKKEKKPKVKKEKKKKEKQPEKPIKRLPKKKVIVTFVFAFSILTAILLLEFIVPPMFSLSAARTFYDEGDYKSAYLEYYGKKLSEEDEMKFQGTTTILRLESNLDGYYNYLAIDEEVMAVHSLLEGVKVRTDIFAKAESYGVVSEVNKVYDEILNILNSTYGVSEEEAIALIEIQSDVTYTNELNSIVMGNFESVPSETENVSINEEAVTEEIMEEENLLPEELEMLQGGE